MADTQRSPMQLVWRRFIAKRTARIGMWSALAIFLTGTYAPFFASEIALFWWDADGISFPAFSSLFNRLEYVHRHDLLFNLIALLLPIMLVIGFLLRKRFATSKLILSSIAALAVIWILCQIPFIPGQDRFRSVWDNRPLAQENAVKYKKHPEGTFAIFPLVTHGFEQTYQGANLKAPFTMNENTEQRFWMGTDVRGRDVLVRMLYGARISLTVGLVATGISLIIGTIFGALSGYFGGWVDLIMQRMVEVMMSFPTFPLVMVVVAMTGRNVFIMMAVIGLTGWAGTARLVRGEFLAQMSRDYVLAGRSMGLPGWRIMFRHVLPNVSAPLLIAATFGIAGSVGAESGLAFIGLGDANAPSWGDLMNQGRENIKYGWLIYIPGIAIFTIITALNLMGESLREAMDVKS